MTGWSEYFASFSMALVTLKVVDATLDRVETILKAAECDTANTVSDYVKTIQDTANTLRIGAVKSAVTPLAKKIEDGTIPESLMEVSGLQIVMEKLGLVGGEVPEVKKETGDAKVTEVSKDVIEDAKVTEVSKDVIEDAKVTKVNKDVTEDVKVKEETVQEKIVETLTEEPAVEKHTEEPASTESVTKKASPKKSKKGSKESTPVADLM